MGHIWISMARFVKIFFLDSLSLCGYFMLRSTMALTPTYQDSWERGQSKSNDHSKDLGRIWKGFLNKRAFNKQTTSRDWWCVNGKFHHDCAIGWILNKKPDWLFVQFLWKMKSIWSMCPLRDLLDPPSFCRWTKVQLSAGTQRLGKPCSSWFKSLAL